MVFLDSAVPSDVALAASLGYVRGATVNPALMARAGATSDPLRHLSELRAIFPAGTFFYQPCSGDPRSAAREAWAAFDQDRARTVIKLPAVAEYFTTATLLIGEGVPIAMTGVFTGAQAALARSVGAEWVIPYIDRAARLLGHQNLVGELASILARHGQVKILAAGIKSVEQTVSALRDGADVVSVPTNLLTAIASNEFSQQALEGFQDAFPYEFSTPFSESLPLALRKV